jgi:hypothetical protein
VIFNSRYWQGLTVDVSRGKAVSPHRERNPGGKPPGFLEPL